jgi:hypothetical protein
VSIKPTNTQRIAIPLRRRPPSQRWRTFLSNNADGIAAVDLFVLPTITPYRSRSDFLHQLEQIPAAGHLWPRCVEVGSKA